MELIGTYHHRTSHRLRNLYNATADRSRFCILTWDTISNVTDLQLLVADTSTDIVNSQLTGWLISGTVASDTQPFAFDVTAPQLSSFALAYSAFEAVIDLFGLDEVA